MGRTVKKVGSKREFKEAICDARGHLVVVVFGAKWCKPCKRMMPQIKQMSERYGEDVRFVKVDVEETPKVADKYNVSSLPTYVLIKDGDQVHSVVGANGDKLGAGIKKHK